jgi:hypothetical protein
MFKLHVHHSLSILVRKRALFHSHVCTNSEILGSGFTDQQHMGVGLVGSA